MIVVLPDSKTVHNGSMYSSSVTTGDFERFVARDVVAYTDAHYRTIPERASRGLVGHSMGGYGATRIGMKHADVFGSVYIMSPCCLSPRPAGPPELGPREVPGGGEDARPIRRACPSWPGPSSRARRHGRPIRRTAPLPGAADARAASRGRTCSRSGRPTPPWRSWTSTSGDLRRYRAIAIDVGDQDGLRADAAKLHEALDRYGIANTLRGVPGHPHEQGGRPLPEPRDEVLQPEPLLRGSLPVARSVSAAPREPPRPAPAPSSAPKPSAAFPTPAGGPPHEDRNPRTSSVPDRLRLASGRRSRPGPGQGGHRPRRGTRSSAPTSRDRSSTGTSTATSPSTRPGHLRGHLGGPRLADPEHARDPQRRRWPP